VVVADGSKVIAEAGPGVAAGHRVLVSLRPERLRLNQPNGSAANNFSGRVLEVIYHGDHLRVRLNALGRDDFIVKAPVIGGEGLTVGSEVSISWREVDGRALPL